jgi:hypothetical protein
MSAVDGTLYFDGFSQVSDVDVAGFLKRTLSAEEKASVLTLAKQIEVEVASRCHRNFNTDLTYYEYLPSGFSNVMLKNTPIASMEALYLDGVDKTSLYTANVNYWIDGSIIYFETPVTSSTGYRNSVKIEYKIKKFWGEDVKRIITQWVAMAFLASENAGVMTTSMSFADLSQNFDTAEFKQQIEAMIYRYTDFLI